MAEADANIALLFWHGDEHSIMDAMRAAMEGRQWHMASFEGLTEGERNILRDVLYAAAESVGYPMTLPVRIIVEQERDDPRVFHVVDMEYE